MLLLHVAHPTLCPDNPNKGPKGSAWGAEATDAKSLAKAKVAVAAQQSMSCAKFTVVLLISMFIAILSAMVSLLFSISILQKGLSTVMKTATLEEIGFRVDEESKENSIPSPTFLLKFFAEGLDIMGTLATSEMRCPFLSLFCKYFCGQISVCVVRMVRIFRIFRQFGNRLAMELRRVHILLLCANRFLLCNFFFFIQRCILLFTPVMLFALAIILVLTAPCILAH